MIEFKFSCSNCSQHIQGNDSYSGLQIICPTCKNQVVVPPPPVRNVMKSEAPIPPAIVQAQTASPQPVQRPKATPVKSKKKLIVICSMVGLMVAGAITYILIFNPARSGESDVAVIKPDMEKPTDQKKSELPASNEKQSSDLTTPSESVPASINSKTLSASEIIEKVVEKYDSLTSYSADGKAISLIDGSGVDPAKPNADDLKKATSKPQRTEYEFSIKLGRPDFYRVAWEGQRGEIKSKGAVWSSGDGDFILREMGQTKYMKMKTRSTALATAAGLSGGVSSTMPQIFFKGTSSLLNLLKDATRLDDETIGGANCYVVTGNAMGSKVHLWITQGTHLIKQKQQILGGNIEMPEVTDARIEEALKRLGRNPTEAQKAQMKEALKNMKTTSSQVKGTVTETYQNIEINPPLTKDDFKYEVPAGTKLSESVF